MEAGMTAVKAEEGKRGPCVILNEVTRAIGGDASICEWGRIWPIRQLKNTLNSRALLVSPPAGAVAAHYIIFSNSAVRFEGGWIDGTLNIKRGRLYWGLSDGERGVNIVPD